MSSPARRIWPMNMIKDLIEQAESTGESEATLQSAREAGLFHFAIRNYKRRYGVGKNLTINTSGNTVTLRTKPVVLITTTEQVKESESHETP